MRHQDTKAVGDSNAAPSHLMTTPSLQQPAQNIIFQVPTGYSRASWSWSRSWSLSPSPHRRSHSHSRPQRHSHHYSHDSHHRSHSRQHGYSRRSKHSSSQSDKSSSITEMEEVARDDIPMVIEWFTQLEASGKIKFTGWEMLQNKFVTKDSAEMTLDALGFLDKKDILEGFGLSLMEWSIISMHLPKIGKKMGFRVRKWFDSN